MKTHEIPWMTGGTAVKNTQLGVPGMFRLRGSDGITAAGMTNFAVKDKKGKKVAILHASDAFGTGGADQIVMNLKAGPEAGRQRAVSQGRQRLHRRDPQDQAGRPGRRC